jgi:hypothetical protein
VWKCGKSKIRPRDLGELMDQMDTSSLILECSLSTLSKKLGFVKLFSLKNLRRKPNLNMEIVGLT